VPPSLCTKLYDRPTLLVIAGSGNLNESVLPEDPPSVQEVHSAPVFELNVIFSKSEHEGFLGSPRAKKVMIVPPDTGYALLLLIDEIDGDEPASMRGIITSSSTRRRGWSALNWAPVEDFIVGVENVLVRKKDREAMAG